jgi:hypothetical protein
MGGEEETKCVRNVGRSWPHRIEGVSLDTKPISARSADSALVVTLPAGAYSAEVTGAGDATGVALAEL